jgi:DNA-binding CsgD family transcriptional regulator/tetratricopeptide (TPR) repeat protein
MNPGVNNDPTRCVGNLIGREREVSTLDALLAQVGKGGGALLIRGEAGIGKSALLAAASDHAENAGMQVSRMSGVRSEMPVVFAMLHQMLRPLLAQAHGLGQQYRHALVATFGRDDPATSDTFTISIAVLELLAEVGRKAPLLVTVDDAQWLDSKTAEVLGFVARRLGPEPVALLIAVREGYETSLEGFDVPELRLQALNETWSSTLLDARAPCLSPGLRARVLAEAAGNPAALVELAVAPEPGHAVFGRPERLPTTAKMREVFADQFLHLPAATQTVLLVACADERATVSEVVAAAADIDEYFGVSVDDFVPAVHSGLVEVDHTQVNFRHPLIPASIYENEPAARRCRVHAALATVLADDPNRRAWHRAASTTGLDEALANELITARFGDEPRGRPGMRVAALERAAELTSSTSQRQQWLLRAAEIAVELGHPDRARLLLGEISHDACGPLDEVRVQLVWDMVDNRLGADPRAIGSLTDAAIQANSGGQTELALRLLQAAAVRSWWSNAGWDVRSRVAAAARQVEVLDGEPRVLSILAITDPEGAAKALFELGSETTAVGGTTESTFALGTAFHMTGAFHRSFILLTEALRGLRRQGSPWVLPQALAQQAWNAIYVGDYGVAIADAEEAAEVARCLGQPCWEAVALTALSMVAAIRGNGTTVERSLAQAESLALAIGASVALTDAQLARAVMALGAGRYEEAFEHMQRTLEPRSPAHHYLRSAWGIGELAEAAVHAGRVDEARGQLIRFEGSAYPDLSPCLRFGLLYARALLAHEDDADALFQAALRQDLTSWPLYRARLLLHHGIWLRRHRHVVRARMPLRAAYESFLALGATLWGGRARQELRASRETHHNGVGAWVQLTEQELQIAHMAAHGLSNREIGQRLCISARTVGSHLYRIFPKLGIATRAQLAAALEDSRPCMMAS